MFTLEAWKLFFPPLEYVSSKTGFQQKGKGASLRMKGRQSNCFSECSLQCFWTELQSTAVWNTETQRSRTPSSLQLCIPLYSGKQIYETAESDCVRLPSLPQWSHFPSISTHSHHCHLKNSSKRSGTKPPLHFPHKFHILETYMKYKICGNIWSTAKAMIKF